MDLQQLRYFVQAARLESFTRAARQCDISQPSLSQQIGKLELELGKPVFERRARKVVLTEAGRLLLEHAETILALADEAKSRIADQDLTGHGRVSLAAIPTIAPYLLPKVLTHFARAHPHASVEVYEDVTERSIAMCLQAEVDLILLALPVEHDGLHIEPLFEDELLVALPRGHELASRKQLSLKHIVREPFILLNDEHCLSGDILALCRRRDFQPRVTCRGSQLDTVQRLIALGQGISLIPRLAAEADSGKQRIYRSLAERPTRTVVMAWRKNRFQSRLVRGMIETIRGSFDKRNRRR